MPKIDELWYDIDGRTGKLETALQRSQAQARGFASFMTSSRGPQGAVSRFASQATTRIKSFGTKVKDTFLNVRTLIVGVFAGIAARVGKQLFDVGAAAAETENKFREVFGGMSETVNAFLDDFANMAGLSREQGQGLIATTGAIAQGMGFAQSESAAFSEQIVQLAGDLASFNNLPTADVLMSINSALTGERERMKRLGIVIRETDVQQRALNETGKTSVKQLTQQERAMATLQIITERAGAANDDLARTQGSAANRAKQLGASFRDLRDELGRLVVDLLTTRDNMGDTQDAIQDLTVAIRENSAVILAWTRVTIDTLLVALALVRDSLQAVAFAFASIGDPRNFQRAVAQFGDIKAAIDELRESTAALARVQMGKELSTLLDELFGGIGEGVPKVQNLSAIMVELAKSIRASGGDAEAFTEQAEAMIDRAAETGEEAEVTADKIRVLAESFREADKGGESLEERLKRIRAEIEKLPVPTDLGGERPNLRALRETLATLREEAEVLRSLADVRPLTQAEQQRLDMLEELVAGLQRAKGLNTELAEAAEEYKLHTDGAGENVVKLADELARGARSLLDGAQAAGLLDSNLASALNSVINIAQNVGGLEKAIRAGSGIAGLAGPVGGIVAGVANVIASLIGPSPAEQLNRDLQVTLRLLDEDIEKLRNVVQEMGEEQLAAFRELRGIAESREVQLARLDLNRGEFIRRVTEELDRLKISMFELQQASRLTGIPIDNLLDILINGKGDLESASAELLALLNAIGLLPDATDRATRAIEQLRLELDRAGADIRRFGVEDPAEQVRVTLRAIADSIDRDLLEKTFPFGGSPLDQLLQQLAAIDVSSVSGARQAIDLVNQFIDLIRAPGGQIGFGIGEVGEEVEAALEGQLINLIETLRRVVEADGGREVSDGARRVAEALRTLGEVLREQIGLLQTEFAILDIEDPVERLRVALERLSGFAPGLLGGAEIETVAGRRRLEEAIERAFTEARLGRVPEGFERADFLALLGEIEGLLDAVTVETEAAGETFQAVQIPQVTEVQFSELISKADTRNFLLRQIRNVLSTGDVGLTPPSADAVSTFAPAASGGATIGTFLNVESLNVVVDGDGDAQAIAAQVSEDFGRRLVDILRANGVTVSSFLNN